MKTDGLAPDVAVPAGCTGAVKDGILGEVWLALGGPSGRQLGPCMLTLGRVKSTWGPISHWAAE